MTRRIAFLTLLALPTLMLGCWGSIKTEPGKAVEVTGTINGPDGKPLNNVLIYFQATGGAAQGVNFPVKDGKFSGTMNAGKYTYYIGGEGARYEAVLKNLPANWKQASLDRQIDVTGGELKLVF